MRRQAVLVLVALAMLGVHRARAEVARYALIIGNNLGAADEERLRYAEDDAQRVSEVLRDLGGFRAENLLVLRGERADSVRRALISLNDRIRTQVAGGRQAELFVYYSGHADQAALHLGPTAIELVELEQLVRGSAATLRLLILDSCRSGGLTHVKGGRIAPGFTIALDQRLPGDGVVFWTASAESESAQESEALRGSFFTHYLVSGLLGAADRDANDNVTLDEAYRYAYENTLRSTSRTLSGTQHPTFRYELGGAGEVVLSTLGRGADRASITFPEGKTYLLISGSADGAVVAEVGAMDRTRRLSVRPGRYFVRGRGPDFLLEGLVALRGSDSHAVRDGDLERIEYARLVRKGHSARGHIQSLQAGYAVRSALWAGAEACQGPYAGYAIEFRAFTIAARANVCRGAFENPFLRATTDEVGVELRGSRVWDIGRFSLETGVSIGASLLRERFMTDGLAPTRTAGAAHLGAFVGVHAELVQGFYTGIDTDTKTYFFDQQGQRGAEVGSTFALRLGVLLGKHW